MIPTETAVWIECDFCGRAYGGPGLTRSITRIGSENLCNDCVQPRHSPSAQLGVAASREAAVLSALRMRAKRDA